MDPEDPAVTRFREYLRIPSVQPQPDYASCVSFLQRMAQELQLTIHVYEFVAGKPVVVLTWTGTRPEWSSILLNSHLDVVPVFEENWKSPPFEARKWPNGDIVARGSQDMKCVGMGYLEAIRRLQAGNQRLKRTLHVCFVPDEEIGGEDGMRQFIEHDEFKQLRVGFALDEGLANPGPSYKLFYGERTPWWINMKAKGSVGHGSQFITNTAASKIRKIINRLMEFRDAEERRLQLGVKGNNRVSLSLGDVTSCNWTMLSGGVQHNVVPETMQVGFDIRVSPSMKLTDFKRTLEVWAEEAECELEWVQYHGSNPITPITDKNVWWQAIRQGSEKLGVQLEPEIFPAATDSRYLRDIGIPAIGISPIRNTPVLLHDHNEFLNEQVYLEGIQWYEEVIRRLGNITHEEEQTAGTLLC